MIPNKKIRICLVSHTMKVGGMERVMAGFANYLVSKPNLEIYLILLLREDHFYQLDKRIVIIEPKKLLHEMPRWKYMIRTLFWLRSTILKIKPATILSFGEYWNSFMLVSTFGLKFPKYISDRSNPVDNMRFIHETIRKYTYKTATGFVAQTSLAANIIKKKTGLSNSIVVGNPIRSIPENKSNDRQNIIINVGRLIPFKQQAKLIGMFAKTSSNGWKLQILGDGPLLVEINDLVKELKLEGRVELLGSVKNVDEYLTKAKIFAFTSSYEGFPNALAEGMAAGLAPISFDCPSGPSDLILDGINGFLIPLNNEDSYIEKLQILIDNEEMINMFQCESYKRMSAYQENIVSEKIFSFITAII